MAELVLVRHGQTQWSRDGSTAARTAARSALGHEPGCPAVLRRNTSS